MYFCFQAGHLRKEKGRGRGEDEVAEDAASRPVCSKALVHAGSRCLWCASLERRRGRFIPLDKSNSTECPEAGSEFTEKYVGRIRAAKNACFLRRHNRDPWHVKGWLCHCPLHVLLAQLCPAGFPVNCVGLLGCLQRLVFPCPLVLPGRLGVLNVPAEAPTIETLPTLQGKWRSVGWRAAEFCEVWCLVPEADQGRGWQALTHVLCLVRSSKFRYLSSAWPCCPGLL